MFNFNSKENEIETIIGSLVKVEGDFVSKGNVIVDGDVVGTLKTEKDLRVGPKAKIAANIYAANAFIAGEVKGNIKVKERLELTETSRIFGDIEAKTLIIAAGAVLNGKCVMCHESQSLPLEEVKNELKKNNKKS
jgi:cytoskeletal protein CcmA (bactofilin family)